MKLMRLFCGCFACATMISSAFAVQFVVKNNLPASNACINGGNSVTFFVGSSQQTVPPGSSSTAMSADLSQLPGLGIQVNNWYWIQPPAVPPQKSPQNPDNSGEQFAINNNCVITGKSAAWFGKGIQTDLIANISAAMSSGTCVITVASNSYTKAVTPNCCAPPTFSTNVCTGPYGATQTGQQWPPS
ncbi:MAG TPA: hypothetical protein VJK30_04905 [Coxiellaceae bacterium]|nr:MAG: hypothetical protein A3E81_00545 [Gammaproteobacteria bacterium RIFCSPHIGHO2_12_FULL_36_30]HLB56647.1 hypothetical protein [Coxiellaceae bacterium]